MDFINLTDGWLKRLALILLVIVILFDTFIKNMFGDQIIINIYRVLYYGFFPAIGLWIVFLQVFGSWIEKDELKTIKVYKIGKLFELAIVCGIGVGYYISL